MVSVYRSPQQGQEFAPFYSEQMAGYRLNNDNLIDWSTGPGLEDPSKKVRKPYTITKSRESWSEQEHDKFLEALQLFDRDWKKIEAFVGSKTVIQIRSHAQKYFLKVQKSGTSEHIPPPRPKRKAAHPYPHKAVPKNNLFQAIGSLDAHVEHANAVTITVPANQINAAPVSFDLQCDDIASACGSGTNNYYCSSSSESTPHVWTSNETTNRQLKENYGKGMSVRPDFAQVNRFVGSIFDPSASDHLQQLKRMDPINL